VLESAVPSLLSNVTRRGTAGRTHENIGELGALQYIFRTVIKYQKIEALNFSERTGMNPLRTGLITSQHQSK
jgi:hypothetical protein